MKIPTKLLVPLLLIVSTQSTTLEEARLLERWIYRDTIMTQRINNVKPWIEKAERKVEGQSTLQKFIDYLNDLTTDLRPVIKVWTSEEHARNEAFVIEAGKNILHSKEINGIDKIRSLFLNESPDSLLSKLLQIFKSYEKNKLLCGTGHSPQDFLYSLYSALVNTELKAYAKRRLVTNMSKNQKNKSPAVRQFWDPTLLETGWSFHLTSLENMKRYKELFIAAMQDISREFRACDRGDFVRGETYFELEGAAQWFIPTSHNVGKLNVSMDICEAIDIPSGITAKNCDKNSHSCAVSAERPCFGKIFDCQQTTRELQACLATNGPRRYEWLKLNTRKRYSACNPQKFLKIKRSEKIPCICQCNDNHVDSHSTHLVNLQPVESDVAKNMVVTGVRFRVQKGILQFQIQQGILRRYGKVENAGWKPINDISEKIRAARLGKKLRGEAPGVEENQDFLVLTRYNNSEMNLHTLVVDNGYVLTGVKFDYPQGPGRHEKRLQIALLARKFNLNTGKLDLTEESKTIRSTIVQSKRFHFKRNNILRPTFPTVPGSESNNYFIFDSSSLTEDSGQTTLPYFDAIPVVSDPPSPLGGFGIFHKTKRDFTGFVSPKLVSLNYTYHMARASKN